MIGKHPNLLWILTTQWRAQALGYAGDPNARTPALDALAAESADFAQAVTPHPFGPFARAAILTGVPSPENGLRDYFDPLPPAARTIAHDLAESGYATAFFGKWHLARRSPGAPLVGEAHARTLVPPESRGGFHLWEGFESGFLLNDPWLHGTRLPEPARFPGYQSDVLCRRAAEWIASAGEPGTTRPASPWFCLVSLEPPHPPYDAPADGVPARNPREIVLRPNVPRGGEAESRARRELAGYYAHIEATDRALGRLLARAPAADTIVVFTSVHGDMHGAHGLFRKGWPQEESVRVPLLIRLPPGGKSGGGRREDAVSLLDLRGAARSWAAGGLSPFPASGPSFARISMPSAVPLPLQCDRPWRGIRSAGRKLVLGPSGRPWLFFDLEHDPWERENLADDPARQPEIASLIARALSPPPGPFSRPFPGPQTGGG